MSYADWFLSFREYRLKNTLFALSSLALMLSMHRLLNGADLFSLQIAFTPERFFKVINSYTAAQLDGVRFHFMLDMLYPVAYSLLFSGLLAALLRVNGEAPVLRLLLNLAPIAGILDLLENSLLVPYVADLAQTPERIIYLMSLAAAGKWLIIFAILLALIWGLGRMGVSFMHK